MSNQSIRGAAGRLLAVNARKGRPFLATALMFLLMLASSGVVAGEAGRLLFARGDVRIVGAQERARPGTRGDVVNEGERVVTGRASVAQIRLSDGGMVALRSNSDYLFEQQRYDGQDSSLSAQAGRLFRGFMRSVTGAIGNQQASNVRHSTPVATIGIRGTVFQAIHIDQRGSEDYPDTPAGTYLLVEEGGVEMFNEGGRGFVGPGDVVYVADSSTAPVPAPGRHIMFRIEAGGAGDREESGDDQAVEPVANDGRMTDSAMGEPDADDRLNETLAERLALGSLEPPPFERLTALGATVYCPDNCSDISPSYQSDLMTASSADGVFTVAVINGDPATFAQQGLDTQMAVQAGEVPANTGSFMVTSDAGDAVTSAIYWGAWADSQYDLTGIAPGTDGPAFRDWHYMLASQSLQDFELGDLGLTGSYRYSYVGGTGLVGGAGIPDLQVANSSSIDVDFGAGEMLVMLDLLQGGADFGSFTTSGGPNALGFLYSGIILDQIDGTAYANMSGSFVGAGAEGIISLIEVFDDADQWAGTAAFADRVEETGVILP